MIEYNKAQKILSKSKIKIKNEIILTNKSLHRISAENIFSSTVYLFYLTYRLHTSSLHSFHSVIHFRHSFSQPAPTAGNANKRRLRGKLHDPAAGVIAMTFACRKLPALSNHHKILQHAFLKDLGMIKLLSH